MAALRSAYSSLPVSRLGDPVDASGPPIALCSDEQFAFQTQVALASIFLNSPRRTLDLVVFAYGWRDPTVDRLDRLVRRFGRSITVVRVDDTMLARTFTSPYLPRATFFKLLIPEVLDGERLLFVDSDIIAQIDIDQIWQDYRDDMLVGGVADLAGRDWKRRIGSPEPDIYINGGVLLITSRRWREERVIERCAEWLEGNHKLAIFADQDVINNAIVGSIYYLPAHWNVTTMNLPRGWRLDPDGFRGIYHFAGRLKPWMRWADPVLQAFYLHYARVVGLPGDYWVEARNAREAMMEARWAEEQGHVAKARDIYRRVANAALAKVKELSPEAVVELPLTEPGLEG
jgi:lipopolysaccharide biosynthesis glycosyltransferase